MILHIPGPAGRLEALVDDPGAQCTTASPIAMAFRHDRMPLGSLDLPEAQPRPPRAAVIIGHPHPLHGGTMHTKAVFQTAKAFCRLGCAVLRFNFRGVGTSEGTFGNGLGEVEDYWACLEFMASRFPGTPLWAAGVSFGSWVALSAGADDERVTTLIGLAMPTEMYDFSRAAQSDKPKYFVHGEHDEICPLKSMREFYAHAAEPKELAVIEASNHLFDGRLGEVGETLHGWLAEGE